MEGSARMCCGRHVSAPSASLCSSCLPSSACSQRFCPLLQRGCVCSRDTAMSWFAAMVVPTPATTCEFYKKQKSPVLAFGRARTAAGGGAGSHRRAPVAMGETAEQVGNFWYCYYFSHIFAWKLRKFEVIIIWREGSLTRKAPTFFAEICLLNQDNISASSIHSPQQCYLTCPSLSQLPLPKKLIQRKDKHVQQLKKNLPDMALAHDREVSPSLFWAH